MYYVLTNERQVITLTGVSEKQALKYGKLIDKEEFSKYRDDVVVDYDNDEVSKVIKKHKTAIKSIKNSGYNSVEEAVVYLLNVSK